VPFPALSFTHIAERKLQTELDGRIYVELVANEWAAGKGLVSLARKPDLRALVKLE